MTDIETMKREEKFKAVSSIFSEIPENILQLGKKNRC